MSVRIGCFRFFPWGGWDDGSQLGGTRFSWDALSTTGDQAIESVISPSPPQSFAPVMWRGMIGDGLVKRVQVVPSMSEKGCSIKLVELLAPSLLISSDWASSNYTGVWGYTPVSYRRSRYLRPRQACITKTFGFPNMALQFRLSKQDMISLSR